MYMRLIIVVMVSPLSPINKCIILLINVSMPKPSDFLKEGRAEEIWSGYYSYSFASSSFLNLIIVPLLSLLIHQRHFAIHTNPLLCSISETLFLEEILIFFVICTLILRRIRGKWVQIVVGGMGSPVIR